MRARLIAQAVLLGVLLSWAAPVASWACSTGYNYVRPSNFELVQIADAIVIAEPISTQTIEAQLESITRFRVIEVLKGATPPDIEVEGLEIGETWPSDPTQIERSHPEGHRGPCIRTTLAMGKPYMLFLGSHEGGLHPLAYPFSRVSEDYLGERSLWTRAVRTYLAMQREPDPMAQVAQLEALKATIRGKLWRSTFDRALARDIDNHLGSISPWKPTEFLLRAYDEHMAGRPPRYHDRDRSFDWEGVPPPWWLYPLAIAVLTAAVATLLVLIRALVGLAFIWKKGGPALGSWRFALGSLAAAVVLSAGAVATLLAWQASLATRFEREQLASSGITANELRKARILYALLEGDHPQAVSLFETFALPNASPDELGRAIQFFAKHGEHGKAFALIETRALNMLKTAPRAEFFALLYAISAAQEDPYYGDGEPRWRQNPGSAVRWPGLALTLTRLSEERFGESPNFTETLTASLGSDLRANPELTFMLAGHMNAIGDWARIELQKPENLRLGAGPAGGTERDPLLLPLKIMVRWHGVGDEEEEEAAIISRIFCLSGAQRKTIFATWGRWSGPNFGGLMNRFAASPSLTPEDRQVLAGAAAEWYERAERQTRESWFSNHPAGQKMVRGEPVTARDIAPLEPLICPGPDG